MLEAYKKDHEKSSVQYIITDIQGVILESDGDFFLNIIKKSITSLHLFFENITSLLETKDEAFLFSCIHISTDDKAIIADITLKTYNNKHLIIIQDLTAHYNNYQLTAQTRNESVINTQILELKNKYLKEKEDFKNTFIANFSHEIREPLSGISTFIEILKKTNLSSVRQDYINIIRTSSNHLKHMIEDILDISKIEVGKLNLVEEVFDLHEFLEELVFTHKIKAQQKALVFEYEKDSRIPQFIIGDPFRLKQILNNVLDNALKYTTKGSVKFQVSLNQIRANKANIHFEIVDTGIGIEKENLEKVFSSFIQLNQNKQNKGTGLGLAIVKNLVELMKGNISLESTFQEGSKFSFNLNFKVDLTTKNKDTKTNVASKQKLKSKYNILLVEHSEIIQLSVLKILASHGKFYLDIVSNPEDVIPTIQNQNVDVILMDINLPNTTGDALTKQIRKLPEKEYKKIPIIALTGNVYPEDLKRYKKAKINDVIAKPFNENSLIETINKHIK